MPLRWAELAPEVPSNARTVANLPERLERLRSDPWAGYWRCSQELPAARRRADEKRVAARGRRKK
ncbi:MAG: hypothetical protein ACREQY_10860 [Candidatus Binatia bacterium]